MAPHHFVVISFPAQGHINPNIQLAKRLIRLGIRVTFITSSYARLRDTTKPLKGLKYVEFNDGYGQFKKEEADQMQASIKQASSDALKQVVSSAVDEGCPVSCITYSLLIPGVPAVARELQIPSAFVWIQAATIFDVYYNYNHGFEGVLSELDAKGPSATFKFPGLPLTFKKCDLPAHIFTETMADLDAEVGSAIVLVNSFDALEFEALESVPEKIKLIPVGPLIQTEFLDTELGGKSFDVESHVKWLDSKPDSSVVYVSFGTFSNLQKQQLDEIGRGLLDLGKPFLWVIREYGDKLKDLPCCIEELEQLGLIVPWCSQFKVLSHPALSCFFTHCGWNSTIESLINEVPIVGFPLMFDQFTNAKLIEDYFKIGVRVIPNSDGLVERGEIIRCLELVMGDENIRQNAKIWKKLAVEAVEQGGSSDNNLKDFVNNIVKCSKN